MTNQLQRIAVIGAGLSGSTLSQRLSAAGLDVTLFEKSRGTGGRLASSRLGENSVDLGAPFFDPISSDFASWLSEYQVIDDWHPRVKRFLSEEPSAQAHYLLSSPRQSAFTRQLCKDAELITSTRIETVTSVDSAISLVDEQQVIHGHFDAVISAAPAQQAVQLLKDCPKMRQAAEQAMPEACWVLIVELKVSETTAVDLFHGSHPVLARCVKNSSKPGRDENSQTEIWSIEANALWSETQLNNNSEAVALTLLQNFLATTGIEAELVNKRCHRWLYCRYPASEIDFLWDAELKIGACGDWLSCGGLEGAWRSANKLADTILHNKDPDQRHTEPSVLKQIVCEN